MKKLIYLILAVFTLSFTSCEALFDNLEGDLTKMTAEDMVSSDAGIQMLLAQVYSYAPVNPFGIEDQYTLNAVDSHGGDYGFNSDAYYGLNGVSTFWNWGAIRTINAFITKVGEAKESGVVTESAAKQYIAEARFIRAYCYFAMVRVLGGVPIITEVLDKYYDGIGNAELMKFCPRATEKETWDFVLSELDATIADLAETPVTEFRVSKYGALGLKVRVALYAASVSKYWSAQGALPSTYKSVAAKKTYMEPSYASNYYNQCIAACEAIIGSGKFALFGANPANVAEAVDNLTNLFVTKQNSEYIWGVTLNNGVSGSGNNFDVYNSPAQTVTGGNECGRYSVASDLVDLYPYYDASFAAVNGTIETRNDGKETEYFSNVLSFFPTMRSSIDYKKYDKISDPFQNKDARFQAWVLYPDCTFRNTTIKIQGGLIKTDGKVTLWTNESETIGDVTYYSLGDVAGKVSGFENYENTRTGNTYTTGFGLRKFLNPSSYQLYCKLPWYDIRYAEILLSYCEAVVENNVTAKVTTAKQYLNDIRHRAAFKDNIDPTIENILKERRLELAFESDYVYTLHRRRDLYNKNFQNANLGKRHTLTPVLTLEDGTPKYIFVRSIFFQEDAAGGGTQPDYHTEATGYYKAISDFGVNGYEPNPVSE